MAEMTTGSGAAQIGTRAVNLVNVVGAVMSVGLVIGVGVWGYKLLMRDVTGVPVVRAMAGEMRVAPENPGGEIAANIGLSVNAVPAEGGAAAPEDRLVLAPAQPDLPQEDLEVAPVAEAEEVIPTAQDEGVEVSLENSDTSVEELVAVAAEPRDPDAPLTAEDVLALADQIAAGADPLTELEAGEEVPVEVAINGVSVNPDLIDASVPGVARSLRPMVRPARAVAPVPPASQAQTTAAALETGPAPALTGTLPAGTKLVQLGAYDSPEIAAQEWARMNARFGEYMQGKDRVIQEAQSGGRTFYRLRAMGFADLSDARRLCAALVAQNVDCIPVVVR